MLDRILNGEIYPRRLSGSTPGLKDEAESFSTDDSHLFDDQVDTFTEAACIWMENGGGVGPLPNMSGLIQINEQ